MEKINEIIDKYKYDKTLRMYSNKYYFRDNTMYAKIMTKDDVDATIRSIEYYINYYKKLYPLHIEDVTDLEKALGEYEIAINKVLQCYSILKINYTADELQKLIDNISSYENEIKEINLRRMCQD